jgi:hypothetical protein
MKIRMFREWYCCSPQLDRVVCGGLPQRNSCLRVTRTRRSECWWFGNRFSQPTGESPVEVLWHELATIEHGNFGIRNILLPKNSLESQSADRTSPYPTVALRREFIGMRSRFMRRMCAGMMDQGPCTGTDRSIESPLLSRKRSTNSPDRGSETLQLNVRRPTNLNPVTDKRVLGPPLFVRSRCTSFRLSSYE